MTAPRTPPSTARAGAHDPATVFVRTVAEAVRQSKIAVQNDPAPLANPLTAGTHLTGGSYNGSVSVIFATDATNANTASTIVARDASGNFAATTITAALTGNASTATALQTPRTINGTSFDGTANIVVTAAAGTLTGTTLNATVVTSSLTSVGTLTGLTVKGTVAIAGASSGAVSFVAPAAAGSATYVLPDADGSNNYVLTTDGSGNLSWSVKTGGSGGTISTINGDGSAAQTLAAGAGLTIVDAGPVHTFALDLNYAPTFTTTITAAGFAGPLTGDVTGNLTGTVLTASQPDITTAANLTTIGTLVAGAVPASLVTAGTFGAGNYVFPADLTITGAITPQLVVHAGTNRNFLAVTDATQLGGTGVAIGSFTDGAVAYAPLAIVGSVLVVNPATTFNETVTVLNDFSVATNKFTVDHATGNTVAAGTIGASNFSGSSSGTNTGDQTTFAWSAVTGTPTTLSGYGITDAYTKTAADARYAPIAGPFPWSDVSSTPTSLGGYGITDAYTKSASDARFAAISGPFPWSDVSGTPTTLAGYGITDAYTKTAADARYSPIAGSSSIVTVGTLGAGSIPANLLTGATFGAGTYTFPVTITGLIVHCVSEFTGQMTAPANVDASSLPTTAGTTGFLWVDTTGGLNIVKRA